MALAPQQFCVRWNSYHTNLQTVFPKLLSTENFADVTLACESRQLRCHKVVLSACSAYFERLLVQNPCKHPIIFMKDMRFSEMQSLVDFMYKGEVNVAQDDLPSLLKSAEALQIRGLCSSDAGSEPAETPPGKGTQTGEGRDYTLASEALLHQLDCRAADNNGPSRSGERNGATGGSGGLRRRGAAAQPELKEERVEEDGLFYGELDGEQMEFNEDEESGKAGSSIGQSSEFAIANVQCQYESGDEGDEGISRSAGVDHNYEARAPAAEPPAFIIAHVDRLPSATPMLCGHGATTSCKLPAGVTLATPLCYPHQSGYAAPAPQGFTLGARAELPGGADKSDSGKRVRRSEEILKQAADCVSRGLTFQTVSDQFNIPISTIRFFMARKGILPRRRRGRSTLNNPTSPTEPPYHIQHYKLPDMLAMRGADESDAAEETL